MADQIVIAHYDGFVESVEKLADNTWYIKVKDGAGNVSIIAGLIEVYVMPCVPFKIGDRLGKRRGELAFLSTICLQMPSQFIVAPETLTNDGCFVVTWNKVAANKIFAGPVLGDPAVPTFRGITSYDLGSEDFGDMYYTGNAGAINHIGPGTPGQVLTMGIGGMPAWADLASSYVLPIATASVLGGIKVGSGLSITGSGVLSATGNAGTVTSVGASFSNGNAINITNSPIVDSGTFLFGWQGTTAQYVRGDGSLATFPTFPAETDPIFTAHPSFSITAGNITNWNNAFSWGNHALAGYLTSITANNGLHTSSNSNVQLGGNPLIEDTTIAVSTFRFYITGNTANAILEITQSGTGTGLTATSGGTGIRGTTTGSGSGVFGQGSTGFAVGGLATGTGYGLFGTSNAGCAIGGTVFHATGHDQSKKILELNRGTSGGGVPLAGIGAHITWNISNDALATAESGRIAVTLTDVTNGASVAKYDLYLLNTTLQKVFTVEGNGAAHLHKYGTGIHGGTAAYYLATTAAGKVIEVPAPGDGGIITEEDPVFMGHVASGITGTMISNWNTAFGWGSHAGLYVPLARTITINGVAQDLSANRSWTINVPAETDPVFTAHAAFGITAGMITNWNTAFGWGNHSGLYVPLARTITINGVAQDLSANRSWTINVPAESDPIFTAHAAFGITAGMITNWNDAHGWGNHALAGYLTTQTDDIRNQVASAQAASFWIAGSGRIDDGLTLTRASMTYLTINDTTSDILFLRAKKFGVNTSIFIGNGGLNSTNSRNTAYGWDTMLNITTAFANTAVGVFALKALTTGSFNSAVADSSMPALTTGNDNVAQGNAALFTLVSGNYNVAIGTNALEHMVDGISNTAIGKSAGRLQTGSHNVFIGRSAGAFASTASYRLFIDVTSTSAPLIYGEFDNRYLRVNGSLSVQTMATVAAQTVMMVVRDQATGDLLQMDVPTGGGAETDPVFSGSPAGTITGQMIADWNTAFGWGSHTGLYVPLGRTITINGVTQDLSANRTWNIAGGGPVDPWYEISFIAGNGTHAPIAGVDEWTVKKCDGTTVTDRKLVLYRERKRQFPGVDYNWDSATGMLQVTNPFIAGERVQLELHPMTYVEECMLSEVDGGDLEGALLYDDAEAFEYSDNENFEL